MARWWRRAAVVLAVLGLAGLPGGVAGRAMRAGLPIDNAVLYVHGGRIWLRSLDGGVPRAVALPWRLRFTGRLAPFVEWSPHGHRLATDDTHGRIAVVDLRSGERRLIPALVGGCGGEYRWSPNDRYLAFFRRGALWPSRGCGTADLWLWDARTGRLRRLMGYVGGAIVWSHDSTRVAIPLAPTQRTPLNSGERRELVSVTVGGRITRYSWGMEAAWSPDDRFLGYLDLRTCGAAHCVVDEGVVPAGGGPRITLARSVLADHVHLQWAMSSSGYGFDRWLLAPNGQPRRRLAALPLRADVWSRDGRRLLAISSYLFEDRSAHRFAADLIPSRGGRVVTLARSASKAHQVPSVSFVGCAGDHTLALQLSRARSRQAELVLATWPGGHVRLRYARVPAGDPVGFARRDTTWLTWSGSGLILTDLRSRQSRVVLADRLVDHPLYSAVRVGTAPVMERCTQAMSSSGDE